MQIHFRWLNTWWAGKVGRCKRRKEQDKVGEGGNPVLLSQGFGGVMGSKTEKVCWGKFMMLCKTQKPTLTLLKSGGGGDCLTTIVSWKPEGRTKLESQGAGKRNGKSPTFCPLPCILQTDLSAGVCGSEGVQTWESTLKLLRECAPEGNMIQADRGDPWPHLLQFPS